MKVFCISFLFLCIISTYQIVHASQSEGYGSNNTRTASGRIKNKSGLLYKKHLHDLKNAQYFTSKRESPNPNGFSYTRQNVLRSSNARTSYIDPRSSIGKRSTEVSNPKPWNKTEFLYMKKLRDNIQDPSTKARLGKIIGGQAKGEKMSKEDYDYMVQMSKKIDHDQVSYRIFELANKRREAFY